jgi:tetratricopeptide (TPR) repeat protein
MERGDATETQRALARTEAIATELGQPTLQWFAHLLRANDLLARGDLEQAERISQQAAEVAEASGQPDGATLVAAQIIVLRWEQDRIAEVETQWAATVARSPDWKVLRALMGFIHVVLDRRAEAAAIFESLAADDFAGIPFDVVWGCAMAQLAAMAAYLDDRPRAAVLYRLLERYENQVVAISNACYGAVAHHLALLATTMRRFDEAESWFRTAIRRHADMGAAPWVARTRLECARMLLARGEPGDADRARALLGQALDTARTLGLANTERLATVLLHEVP